MHRGALHQRDQVGVGVLTHQRVPRDVQVFRSLDIHTLQRDQHVIDVDVVPHGGDRHALAHGEGIAQISSIDARPLPGSAHF